MINFSTLLYYQNKTKRQRPGLGLPLAYDIIMKGHGGKIEFQTEENPGTEFIITLEQSNYK